MFLRMPVLCLYPAHSIFPSACGMTPCSFHLVLYTQHRILVSVATIATSHISHLHVPSQTLAPPLLSSSLLSISTSYLTDPIPNSWLPEICPFKVLLVSVNDNCFLSKPWSHPWFLFVSYAPQPIPPHPSPPWQPSPPPPLTWTISIAFQLVYRLSPFNLVFSSRNNQNHPSKMLVTPCTLLTQNSLVATHVTQSII